MSWDIDEVYCDENFGVSHDEDGNENLCDYPDYDCYDEDEDEDLDEEVDDE